MHTTPEIAQFKTDHDGSYDSGLNKAKIDKEVYYW